MKCTSMIMGILVTIISLFFGSTLLAGPNFQDGPIADITSTSSGVMIKLASGVPDTCAQTPFGWMLIPEKNKAMTALTLMAYSLKKPVRVFSNSGFGTGSSCVLDQVDVN